MIGREHYPILEERTRCAICGSRYRIREEDGTLQLHCEGCDAPVIWWDELAEELNVCHQMANRIYQNALRKMREYELTERESVK